MRDAAIALDVISQYGTAYFEGQAPKGGYTALLGKTTLEGKKIGLCASTHCSALMHTKSQRDVHLWCRVSHHTHKMPVRAERT